jgi:hypothetical protein
MAIENNVEMANDEGADPSSDANKEPAGNPSGKEKPAAEEIDKNDPHKVEKLAKLGHAGDEAAEGTE